MKLTGTYYLANCSQACKVTINIQDDNLLIQTNDQQEINERCDINQVTLSTKLGNLPREIYLPSGSKIMVTERVNLEKLLYGKNHSSIIDKLERHKISILIATLLLPLCLYFLFAVLIPQAARNTAPILAPLYTQSMDQELLNSLDDVLLTPSKLSAEQQTKLLAQWQQVLTITKQPANKPYHLTFRSSEALGANAFALPGGTVVITDALVKLLIDDPDAITAVLLHEVGHIKYHHSIQLMIETTALTLLISYLSGDITSALDMLSAGGIGLLQQSFSRGFEQEADQFAIEQLGKLNISALAFANALTALQGESTESLPLQQYLNSHPLIEERIKQAELASQ